MPEKNYLFLVHYYRAEVYRETAWRTRLDVTTNWAIVVSAGMLSFVFGNPTISHSVILVDYLIVWFFLYIEARRFRYYTMVRDRVKVFEKRFLGPIFTSAKDLSTQDALNSIGDKLINPKVRMTRLESLSWRLRRNYIFIFPIIFVVWVYRVLSYPILARNTYEFMQNASVGFVPGILVFSFFVLTFFTAVLIAFYVSKRHKGDDLP